MKVMHSITRKIVKGLDIANTVSGGMSMATVNWEDNENETVLRIKTPGLDESNYHIDIKDNVLQVYNHFAVNNTEEETSPYFMRYFHLPHYIDLENIVAEYEEGTLQVVLPHNGKTKGFEKNIEIQ